MFKKANDMTLEVRPKLRGGEGEAHFKHLFSADELLGKATLCAIISLDPGCSIGEHPHDPDAELYYLLEGTLEVTDNGVSYTMEAGDAMITGEGKTHSATNKSDKVARILAVVFR